VCSGPPTCIDCHCRKAISLNDNEGVYVRDVQSGQVRCEHGPQAYMLKANEELYEKALTPLVEDLLKCVVKYTCIIIYIYMS